MSKSDIQYEFVTLGEETPLAAFAAARNVPIVDVWCPLSCVFPPDAKGRLRKETVPDNCSIVLWDRETETLVVDRQKMLTLMLTMGRTNNFTVDRKTLPSNYEPYLKTHGKQGRRKIPAGTRLLIRPISIQEAIAEGSAAALVEKMDIENPLGKVTSVGTARTSARSSVGYKRGRGSATVIDAPSTGIDDVAQLEAEIQKNMDMELKRIRIEDGDEGPGIHSRQSLENMEPGDDLLVDCDALFDDDNNDVAVETDQGSSRGAAAGGGGTGGVSPNLSGSAASPAAMGSTQRAVDSIELNDAQVDAQRKQIARQTASELLHAMREKLKNMKHEAPLTQASVTSSSSQQKRFSTGGRKSAALAGSRQLVQITSSSVHISGVVWDRPHPCVLTTVIHAISAASPTLETSSLVSSRSIATASAIGGNTTKDKPSSRIAAFAIDDCMFTVNGNGYSSASAVEFFNDTSSMVSGMSKLREQRPEQHPTSQENNWKVVDGVRQVILAAARKGRKIVFFAHYPELHFGTPFLLKTKTQRIVDFCREVCPTVSVSVVLSVVSNFVSIRHQRSTSTPMSVDFYCYPNRGIFSAFISNLNGGIQPDENSYFVGAHGPRTKNEQEKEPSSGFVENMDDARDAEFAENCKLHFLHIQDAVIDSST